jgi:hypothetical protein
MIQMIIVPLDVIIVMERAYKNAKTILLHTWKVGHELEAAF